MELQTNNGKQTLYRPKLATILIGFSLILVPIIIGILITMPQVTMWLTASWKEVMKGAVVGVSILPITLFGTIKGGKLWYRKAWVWGMIMVAIVVVFTISLLGQGSTGIEAMKSMSTPGGAVY